MSEGEFVMFSRKGGRNVWFQSRPLFREKRNASRRYEGRCCEGIQPQRQLNESCWNWSTKDERYLAKKQRFNDRSQNLEAPFNFRHSTFINQKISNFLLGWLAIYKSLHSSQRFSTNCLGIIDKEQVRSSFGHLLCKRILMNKDSKLSVESWHCMALGDAVCSGRGLQLPTTVEGVLVLSLTPDGVSRSLHKILSKERCSLHFCLAVASYEHRSNNLKTNRII